MRLLPKPEGTLPIRGGARYWGPWRIRMEQLTLTHVDNGYVVDLRRCPTSAQVLDSICQVAGSGWADPTSVGQLVLALNEVLEPQANLCWGGEEQGPVHWVGP
jgi:hypothetical protein